MPPYRGRILCYSSLAAPGPALARVGPDLKHFSGAPLSVV